MHRATRIGVKLISVVLAVCRASRLNPQKIADQAIFYSANCVRSPCIVVFAARSDAKTYKCDRLLGLQTVNKGVATWSPGSHIAAAAMLPSPSTSTSAIAVRRQLR
jgi:hypothetical protein